MKVRIKTGNLAQTDKRFGLTSGMKKIQGEVCEAKKMDDNYWVSKPGSEDQCPYVFDAEDVEEIKSQDFELILDIMAFNAIAKARDIEPDYKTRLEKVSAILSNRVSEKDTYTLADLSDYLITKYL